MDDVLNLEVELEITEEEPIELEIEEGAGGGGTNDYNDLINKPLLNGKVLIGNTDEIDPTVPQWAKEENKPEYTYKEVEAVGVNNEMSFATIKEVWDSVFN